MKANLKQDRFQSALTNLTDQFETYKNHLYETEEWEGPFRMIGFLDAQIRILAIKYLTVEEVEAAAAEAKRYVTERIQGEARK